MSFLPPLSLQKSKRRIEITDVWCCAVVLSTGLPASGCQKYCQSISGQVQSIVSYWGASEAGNLQLFHNCYQQLNARRCIHFLSTVLCEGARQTTTTKPLQNGRYRLIYNNNTTFNKNIISPLPVALCPLPTLLSGYTNFLACSGVTQRRPGIMFVPRHWYAQQ